MIALSNRLLQSQHMLALHETLEWQLNQQSQDEDSDDTFGDEQIRVDSLLARMLFEEELSAFELRRGRAGTIRLRPVSSFPGSEERVPKKGQGLRQDAIEKASWREAFGKTQDTIDDDGRTDLYECILCLECYQGGDELRHLDCEHVFHVKCIDEWLSRNRTCPLCSHNVGTPLERPSVKVAASSSQEHSPAGDECSQITLSGVYEEPTESCDTKEEPESPEYRVMHSAATFRVTPDDATDHPPDPSGTTTPASIHTSPTPVDWGTDSKDPPEEEAARDGDPDPDGERSERFSLQDGSSSRSTSAPHRSSGSSAGTGPRRRPLSCAASPAGAPPPDDWEAYDDDASCTGSLCTREADEGIADESSPACQVRWDTPSSTSRQRRCSSAPAEVCGHQSGGPPSGPSLPPILASYV